MNHEQVRDASLPELVSRLQRDLVDLVDTEKAIAKKEFSQKADELKRDAMELASGGLLLVLGVMSLVACAILAFATIMAAWLAALLVGAVLTIVGAAVLVKFKSDMKRFDAVPRHTAADLKQDAQAIKRALQ